MELADIQALVVDLVRDDTDRIVAPNLDTAVARAVARYSQDRPRLAVADLTAVAGGHLVDLPAEWEAGFSSLISIEHPIGEVPPRLLEADRFALYQVPSGIKIMVIDALDAGAVLRVGFTRRHSTDAPATIPDEHGEALAKWAAALLCDQLAAFYANETDSTIQADSVRQTSKAQTYRNAARDYRKLYFDSVGVAERASAPAGAVVALKGTDSLGGQRFFHPARNLR